MFLFYFGVGLRMIMRLLYEWGLRTIISYAYNNIMIINAVFFILAHFKFFLFFQYTIITVDYVTC